MTWPTDDLTTRDLDSQNDRPPRAEFFKLFQRVKTMIAGRGRAGGVAGLDANGKVPLTQLPDIGSDIELGVPNGAASLDGRGDVPLAQIPNTIARVRSPALTGTPTAPTQPVADRSTRIATTAFVRGAVRLEEGTLTQRTTSAGGAGGGENARPAAAGGRVTFSLPADELIFLPFRFTHTPRDWSATFSFLGDDIAVQVIAPRTGPQYNGRTISVTLRYQRLVIG